MAKVTITIVDKPDGTFDVEFDFKPKTPHTAEEFTQAQNAGIAFMKFAQDSFQVKSVQHFTKDESGSLVEIKESVPQTDPNKRYPAQFNKSVN